MQYRHLSITAIVLCVVIAFSSCSHVPETANYIPRSASAVVGINGKSLGKKILWNVITGSDVFKKAQAQMPDKSSKDAMNGLENAGIDAMNTFYLYFRNVRGEQGKHFTAILPLSSDSKWEGFVKGAFPQAAITQKGLRKEAKVSKDMYMAWSKDVLIIINKVDEGDAYLPVNDTLKAETAYNGEDLPLMMEAAFGVTKDSSLVSNNHFTTLEKAGHDITLWVNQGDLMNNYMNEGITPGLSLSANLWKDAVMAAGFDFVKGKVTGEMRCYVSDDLKEIMKGLFDGNADKQMIENLPAQNLDMIMANHFSPKGIEAVLNKTGMLGLANIGLSSTGMDVKYILDAFTGDMAVALNDFSMQKEIDSTMTTMPPMISSKPKFSGLFVIKINKKENFNKLLQLAVQSSGAASAGNNAYAMPIGTGDSVFLIYNDKYAVVSNKRANAEGFLAGTFKGQKMPELVSSEILGHPTGWYMDVQEFVKTIDPAMNHSAQDSLMIAEGKKLVSNVTFSGGEFSDNSFVCHMSINFTNKEENSLMELLNYGIQVGSAK